MPGCQRARPIPCPWYGASRSLPALPTFRHCLRAAFVTDIGSRRLISRASIDSSSPVAPHGLEPDGWTALPGSTGFPHQPNRVALCCPVLCRYTKMLS